jgi:hypothetical protein
MADQSTLRLPNQDQKVNKPMLALQLNHSKEVLLGHEEAEVAEVAVVVVSEVEEVATEEEPKDKSLRKSKTQPDQEVDLDEVAVVVLVVVVEVLVVAKETLLAVLINQTPESLLRPLCSLLTCLLLSMTSPLARSSLRMA